MYLTLFILLMVLSFILISLGFFNRDHSELSLIGFTFLFLLSILLINNDIQIQTGYDTAEVYIYGNNFSGYHWDYTNPLESRPQDPDVGYLFHTNQTLRYTYEDIDLGGTYSKTFGYWLAIISFVGFVGVLISLKQKKEY